MAKKIVRSLTEEENTTFDGYIQGLEKTIGGESPITKQDKKGGKLSDAELSKTDFIETHYSKFENFLPRDFDLKKYLAASMGLKGTNARISELKRLIKILTNQGIVLRIEMKPLMKDIYEATKKAAAADASLEYISKELGTSYEKKARNGDAKKGKKTEEKSK